VRFFIGGKKSWAVDLFAQGTENPGCNITQLNAQYFFALNRRITNHAKDVIRYSIFKVR
jgi:purine nucleoside permease